METQLNIAVVGCGYWGPNLVRNFSSVPECKVKTVCDLDEKRLVYLKQLYPDVDTTTVFNDVVEDRDVDAVIIATPVRFHYKLAKDCLLAGKHVFIEKPMASSVEQCSELIEVAERKGLTLMVGHTFIYSTAVRTIKDIVEKGLIGDILYISSQRLNLGLYQRDINVAWDLAPHDLSIILYLLEQQPAFINCQGRAHVRKGIEDVTNMSLGFSHGGMAIIHSSWLDPNKVRKMTIVGVKGMIVYDDNEPLEKIKIYDKRVEAPPHYDTYAEFHYSYHYGDMRSPYLKQVEPLKVQSQHFIDCIKTSTKPDSSGFEGLQVVQILEAASQSLAQGGSEVIIEDMTKIIKKSHHNLVSPA
jgi:predicted dehydrogenase